MTTLLMVRSFLLIARGKVGSLAWNVHRLGTAQAVIRDGVFYLSYIGTRLKEAKGVI